MPQTHLDKIIQKNNVKVIGNNDKVILFVHGFGCDQNMWRFVTPYFEKDYKIVLIDLVGNGKSDWNYYDFQKYSSLEAYADDIIEVCEALGQKEVIMIGHSVSSMIGLLVGIKKPEILSRLVMVAPSPSFINDGEYVGGFSRTDILSLLESLESNFLGWTQFITPIIMRNPERPEFTKELENSFCQTDPKISENFAKATFLADYRNTLKLLKTNTLVIQCSDDILAPVSVGEFTANEIPNSTLRVIPAFGHCPHLTHPHITAETIMTFLQN